MSIESTQRNATRNQSTVDYTRKNIFLYGDRYQTAVFNNNTGGDLDLESGYLVVRNTAVAGQVLPATAANLADVIGIAKVDGVVTLADVATLPISYCVEGDIDSGLLTLPATVTLDTVVGNKVLRDILTDLGFKLFDVSENAKTDN